MSLFDDNEFEVINILPQDGEVFYYPNFLIKEEADFFLEKLKEECTWQQDSINFKGKIQLIPRLQAWYGDPEKTFTYSGIKLTPLNWTPDLLTLRTKLEERMNILFTSVLVNLYRDGNDSVSWHADDEEGLGVNAVIASISLGATRTFKLKHMSEKNMRRDLKLEHGSLTVMQGATQHKWFHSVPKEPDEKNSRINLTYRVIK